MTFRTIKVEITNEIELILNFSLLMVLSAKLYEKLIILFL